MLSKPTFATLSNHSMFNKEEKTFELTLKYPCTSYGTAFPGAGFQSRSNGPRTGTAWWPLGFHP